MDPSDPDTVSTVSDAAVAASLAAAGRDVVLIVDPSAAADHDAAAADRADAAAPHLQTGAGRGRVAVMVGDPADPVVREAAAAMAADVFPTARGPAATPIRAETVVGALRDIGATHVVIVPDTHQRTVLELLTSIGDPPIVRAATEADALGICAGLWMAGARPVAVIQQLGLFASVNALRAFTHDQAVPLAIVAGLFGRDTALPVDKDPASAVRLCIPMLQALKVKVTLVEGPQSTDRIGPALRAAFDGPRTSVVLIGAPTC